MKLFDQVIKVLGSYPAVRFQQDGETIEVPPSSPDGFRVSISAGQKSRTVHYDYWHEEFETDADALNWFMLGLTPAVRLRVSRRGDCDHTWTVEAEEDGRWESQGTVGLIFFPFWRRKQVVVLQNRWIEAPPFAEES